jgi:hypothetical protein
MVASVMSQPCVSLTRDLAVPQSVKAVDVQADGLRLGLERVLLLHSLSDHAYDKLDGSQEHQRETDRHRQFDDPERKVQSGGRGAGGEGLEDQHPGEVADHPQVDQGHRERNKRHHLLATLAEERGDDVDVDVFLVAECDHCAEERREDDQVDDRLLGPEQVDAEAAA